MFNIVLAFTLIATSYVTAEIPSYIHVCKDSRAPILDQCILENIDNLKDKICEGIPELDIKPNNPLILGKLTIIDTPNSKIFIKNTQVSGVCDFIVKHLHSDIDKLHFDIELLFRKIQLNGTYDFDIHLLVPIVQQELVYINTENVEAKVNVDLKIVTKSGKRYVYVSKMKINLDIKGYDAEYGLDDAALSRFNQVISNFIGNNQKEVIEVFKPALEEAIVKRVLSLSNDIVKHFTFEELFPDRASIVYNK